MPAGSARSGSGEAGATSIIEYILTFIIASFIFTIFILNFNALFINNAQYIVTRNQLADIGNDVSTKVIDTYLLAPDNGKLVTYFDIPSQVAAGYTYQIEVIPAGDDKELAVYTENHGISVYNTLNGANVTIPINGSTASTWPYHNIVFERSTGA